MRKIWSKQKNFKLKIKELLMNFFPEEKSFFQKIYKFESNFEDLRDFYHQSESENSVDQDIKEFKDVSFRNNGGVSIG